MSRRKIWNAQGKERRLRRRKDIDNKMQAMKVLKGEALYEAPTTWVDRREFKNWKLYRKTQYKEVPMM